MKIKKILLFPVFVSIIFYFIPFFFSQFISPFIIAMGFYWLSKNKNTDKFLLMITAILLYWLCIQILNLEMDQADNLIDISIKLPSAEFINSILIFISLYIITSSLTKER